METDAGRRSEHPSPDPWAVWLARCRSPAVEVAVNRWSPQLDRIARRVGTDKDIACREVRLQLPGLPRSVLDTHDLPRELSDIVELRLASYVQSYRVYAARAHDGHDLAGGAVLNSTSGLYVRLSCGVKLPVAFDSVSADDAEFIETRLHYLRSFRDDCHGRLGLFIKGAPSPFAYAAFASCDRSYLREAIRARLGRPIPDTSVLSLARGYGVHRAPKNAVSLLVAIAARTLVSSRPREQRRAVMTTAINPFLGFDGHSLRVSGFAPLAFCRVEYQYDDHGAYVTRRQGSARRSEWCRRPNLLLARGVGPGMQRRLATHTNPIEISPILHMLSDFEIVSPQALDSAIGINHDQLRRLRGILENAWSDQTRYRATPFRPSDPQSKGQCGVTSAYLARLLSRKGGLEVFFCQGRVTFPGCTPPINDHCWLALRPPGAGLSAEILVDLTADQTGFSRDIVCATRSSLEAEGIHYQESSRTPADKVDVASLNERLTMLESTVDAMTATGALD